MKRSLIPVLLIGAVLLMPLAGLLSINAVRRRQFGEVESRLKAVMEQFRGRWDIDADGGRGRIVPRRPVGESWRRLKGSAVFNGDGSRVNLWYYEFVAVDEQGREQLFEILLRVTQDKRFLLVGRPVVRVGIPESLHPTLVELLQSILKDSGVDFTVFRPIQG